MVEDVEDVEDEDGDAKWFACWESLRKAAVGELGMWPGLYWLVEKSVCVDAK